MSTCAVAVVQPDGSYFLKIDPSITDVSTCAYVVQSGADIANALFNMSADDGALISAGIISVWAVAWGLKALILMLRGSENETV